MTQPHHRFWAHAADAALPPPPPGVLSGGPNSSSRRADEVGAAMGPCAPQRCWADDRSEEHTSELQSLMRISYAVFCLKKKKRARKKNITNSVNMIAKEGRTRYDNNHV